MKIWRVIGVSCVVFVLGVGTADASTKPITIKQAAAQYLADTGPANSASSKFSTALTKWGNANGTAAQTSVFVKPYVNALRTFSDKLLTQKWPAKAHGAITSLVSDIASFEGDVAGLPAVNVLAESQWSTTFDRDATVMASGANIVRSALGLPLSTN